MPKMPLKQIIFLQSKMLELQCGHCARRRPSLSTEIPGTGDPDRIDRLVGLMFTPINAVANANGNASKAQLA